ncbi:MAG: 2OG-Fe(II) oxygenase [Acidobacteriota bacterium]|jgi:Rps23 Pro-64 3,4-dihydroxylase Tpa1-like proline 4-hydroxylase
MTGRDRSDKGEILFRSGLLERAIAALEPAHRADPTNLKLGTRLVDAYRASGDLAAAAELVARLAGTAPDDRWLAYLDDLFSGRATTPSAVDAETVPAPFVVHDGFLPDYEREQIWDFALRSPQAFKAATVARRFARTDIDQRVDPDARRARTISSPREVAALMEPRLRPLVQSEAGRLGLAPPRIDHIELEVAAYGNGDLFRCHQDLFEAERSRRVLSYVYFFAPEPLAFSGGELLLYDLDTSRQSFAPNRFTRIDPACNRLVLFDPATFHEVTPIRCASDDPRHQRYTATGWVHEAVELGERQDAQPPQ